MHSLPVVFLERATRVEELLQERPSRELIAQPSIPPNPMRRLQQVGANSPRGAEFVPERDGRTEPLVEPSRQEAERRTEIRFPAVFMEGPAEDEPGQRRLTVDLFEPTLQGGMSPSTREELGAARSEESRQAEGGPAFFIAARETDSPEAAVDSEQRTPSAWAGGWDHEAVCGR